MLRTLLALAALASGGWSGAVAAQSQDAPPVVSPIRVESDHNGVNLATGRATIEGPVLSVPAAPNLRFDRVQNAAPYVTGTITGSTTGPTIGNYNVHAGGAASESFRCTDTLCESATGTGSVYLIDADPDPPDVREYRQAGSGARYYFDVRHYNLTGPPKKLQYYASRVVWPNGEIITYTYDLGGFAGDPFARAYRRPSRIASNMGYHIDLTYPVQYMEEGEIAWATPNTATLFRTAEPDVPLRRFTYSGNMVTDSGSTIADLTDDRTYTCTSCGGTLDVNVEATSGTLQLPGEGAPAVQIAPTADGQLVQTVTRDGVPWTYAYENPDRPLGSQTWLYDKVTVTGPNGFNQVYLMGTGGSPPYSQFNVVTGIADSLNRTTSYVIDPVTSRPTRVTYPEGNAVSVVYDQAGNVTSRTMHARPGSVTLPATITEEADYPLPANPQFCDTACWRPDRSRDGLERQTDYAYNNSGQMTEQLDPADANGIRRLTATTYALSSNGISRRWRVDVCGVSASISVEQASCGTTPPIRTEYEYFGDTPLVTEERRVDPATETALTTVHSYDAAGRLLSTDGPLAGTDDATHNRYDVHGRRTWEIGARGAGGVRIARRHAYRSSDDKPVMTETGTIPDETSTALTVLTRTDFAYDARRNPIWESLSANGTVRTVTQRTFDESGRLLCSAVRMNPADFAMLPGDACVSGPPGMGANAFGPDRITRTVYDAAGQRLQLREGVGTAAEAAEATWAYNLNGQVTTVIDGNGNRAELRYDGHGRQSCWLFPSPAGAPAYVDSTWASAMGTAGSANGDCVGLGDFEAYGYDAAGNRVWLRKRDGSVIGYQYDGLNRMVVKVVPERAGLDPAHSRDVHYGYDLRNLQTYARFDSASGQGVTNTYDGFGRLATHAIDMSGPTRTLAYEYDPNGNRTRITHPGGIWFSTQYDGLGRPFYLDANGTTGIAYAFYAPHGGVSQVNRVNAATGHLYDAILRPSGLTQHRFGPTGDSVAWSYSRNPAGQLAALTRGDPGPGPASADAFAWTGHYAVERAYLTDGLNRYTAAGPPANPTQGANFTYDLNGNLASEPVPPPAGGTRTFTYDVENRLISASPNVALSYDPLGRLYQFAVGGSVTTTFLYDGDALAAEYGASGAMTRRYAHWVGADVPLVSYEGATLATPTQLFGDHQGSIVAHADWSGNLASINRYDEYGIPAETNMGRFQYTGQIWIPELGMYHYKARVYSPFLGRFLQVDPIGYDDQFNLYAYVGNDPVNAVDPTGRDAIFVIRQNGNVEIQLPILFSGDAANAANIAAITNSMQTAFTRNIGGTNVSLTVVPVTARDIANGIPVYNEVELSSGPLPGGTNAGHSYAEGNVAHINMMDQNSQGFVDRNGNFSIGAKGPETGAHYAGHLMGLPDAPGSGTGVMQAGHGRDVTPNDLSTIIQRDPPGMGVRNTITRCPHPDCSPGR